MLNFTKRQILPLGLDISDISLKMVQFSRVGKRLDVMAYSDNAIPKDVVSSDAVKDPKVLARVIKEAISKPKFGEVDLAAPQVVASVPETKTFVRVIQMPVMSEEEAREAVPWEAEAYIPIPIGQVYLDWVILEGPPVDGKMTVLITASPKDYIDALADVLKQAGLKPFALEVESQATARSLVARGDDETVLIVDIDTARTSFIIYEHGTLKFTSSFPVAGNAFTESIAKGLDINFDDAEKLKRQVGIADTPKYASLRKALASVLNNLVEEIKTTIRFHEEHSSESVKVTRLLLAGGSSKLKHLPSFLHDKLAHSPPQDHSLRSLPGLKVELGNPWVNVLQKGQPPRLSREESLSYSTAIGLALREII